MHPGHRTLAAGAFGVDCVRITTNSPSCLRLQDNTFWISIVCACAAALWSAYFLMRDHDSNQLIPIALFVVFAMAFLRGSDIKFDRTRRVCFVRRLDVFRVSHAQVLFKDILEVRVEASPQGDTSKVIACRLTLVTAAETIPLSAVYEPSIQRYETMRSEVIEAISEDGQRPAAVDPV